MAKKIFCEHSDLERIFLSEELEQDTLLIHKEANPGWRENFLQTGTRGVLPNQYGEIDLLKYLAAQDGSILRGKGSLGEMLQLTLVIAKPLQIILQQSPFLQQISAEGELKKRLGKLGKNDQLMQGREWKWLVLPWAKSGLISLVLLFKKNLQQENERDRLCQIISEHILTFPLPHGLIEAREKKTPIHLAEYDWIYSDSYVGPDRRRDPDGKFLDQFTFRGKRKILPHSTAGRFLGFTDRLSPLMLFLFCSYLFLSCIDTILSIKYISFGHLSELNPLLRPWLSGQRIWIFSLVKNAASLSFFIIVSRFERSSLGLFVAFFNVLIYLILDLYWINIIS